MASNGDSFFQPCVWSNAQSEACSESSPQLSSVDYGVISGKVDLIEAFFNSSLVFHGVTARQLTEATDQSMSGASAAAISQCQAAPWAPGPELLKQENIVTSWGSPLSSSQNQAVLLNLGEEEGAGAATTVVFSSCDNAPTNSYSRSASSGESENRDSCGSQRRAHRPQYYSNLQHQDELVSQCSSNPPATRPGPPGTRPSLLKRKDQEHMLRGERCDLFGNIPLYDSSTAEGGFRIVFENTSKSNKKPRYPASADSCSEPDMEAIAQVKEMIYRAAALRPVAFGAVEAAEKPRRRNVRISSDPQTVAARQRRERIGERLRVLQRLVPGGGRMDTASMLDEAANYLRFLKSQVAALQALGAPPPVNTCTSTPSASSSLHPHSDQFLPFPMQKFPLQQTHASLQGQVPPNVAPATAGAAPFP